jgi:formylglycine-generating enzyme required for sulfatase activity
MKEYPYQPDDGREDLDAEGSRVLRGGAFFDRAGLVRCAFRRWSFPGYGFDDNGFRVVVSPSL